MKTGYNNLSSVHQIIVNRINDLRETGLTDEKIDSFLKDRQQSAWSSIRKRIYSKRLLTSELDALAELTSLDISIHVHDNEVEVGAKSSEKDVYKSKYLDCQEKYIALLEKERHKNDTKTPHDKKGD